MYKILTNNRMPQHLIDMVAEDFELISPPDEDGNFDDETMLRLVEDADALLMLKVRKVLPGWIDAGKKLKVIGNVAVGFDNIDVAYAARKGIAVVNTPNAVREPTAEMAIALMLSMTRGIVQYHNELKRSLRCGVSFFFDRDMMVYGKTLGIVGCGRVGKSVAKKAQGLGMNVVYYDPFRMPEGEEKELALTYLPLDEVLKCSDVVSLHMPLMPSTHHLMNAAAFAKMKPTAYFINTARGPVVDEKALVDALRAGTIKGAALDVFEYEPMVSTELGELENVVIVPHVGTMLMETRRDMVAESVGGIRAVLRGETPVNLVRPPQ